MSYDYFFDKFMSYNYFFGKFMSYNYCFGGILHIMLLFVGIFMFYMGAYQYEFRDFPMQIWCVEGDTRFTGLSSLLRFFLRN